jgi:hypothetical protein
MQLFYRHTRYVKGSVITMLFNASIRKVLNGVSQTSKSFMYMLKDLRVIEGNGLRLDSKST